MNNNLGQFAACHTPNMPYRGVSKFKSMSGIFFSQPNVYTVTAMSDRQLTEQGKLCGVYRGKYS